MPHIHTSKGNYDQTSSAFIIRTDFDQPQIMLHHHKKLHKYLQFGGHVEIGENPWQAVAHEIEEETGYTLRQLRVLQPNLSLPRFEGMHTVIHPLPFAVVSHPYDLSLEHYHTDIGWVFTTDQEPLFKPGEHESLDIRMFTLDELSRIPENEIFENIRVLSTYALSDCLQNWKQIPASDFRL